MNSHGAEGTWRFTDSHLVVRSSACLCRPPPWGNACITSAKCLEFWTHFNHPCPQLVMIYNINHATSLSSFSFLTLSPLPVWKSYVHDPHPLRPSATTQNGISLFRPCVLLSHVCFLFPSVKPLSMPTRGHR